MAQHLAQQFIFLVVPQGHLSNLPSPLLSKPPLAAAFKRRATSCVLGQPKLLLHLPANGILTASSEKGLRPHMSFQPGCQISLPRAVVDLVICV